MVMSVCAWAGSRSRSGRARLSRISSMYAASNASAVKAAEPMANPLPVAAVVLPSESSASMRSRTCGG